MFVDQKCGVVGKLIRLGAFWKMICNTIFLELNERGVLVERLKCGMLDAVPDAAVAEGMSLLWSHCAILITIRIVGIARKATLLLF